MTDKAARLGKSSNHQIHYSGSKERFDDAWDETLEAMADCRQNHPQAQIGTVHVHRTVTGLVMWSIDAQETA